MAKKYELLYVLNGTLSADELRAQMSRVKTIVESSATIEQIVEWGRRRLAYEIQDLREGYYVIVRFTAEPDAPREIERLMRIADYVLRYLIVVAEGDFMPAGRRSLDEEEAAEARSSEAALAAEEPVEEEATEPQQEAAEQEAAAEEVESPGPQAAPDEEAADPQESERTEA